VSVSIIVTSGQLAGATPSAESERVELPGTVTLTPGPWVTAKFEFAQPARVVVTVTVMLFAAIVIGDGFGLVMLTSTGVLVPGITAAVTFPVIVKFALLINEKLAGVAAPATAAVTV
jgi:hypothetical protein